MHNPDTKSHDYREIQEQAQLVYDFMDAESVKDAGVKYLPKPIAIIGKPKEHQMYKTYLSNAYVPEHILPDTLSEMLGMTLKSGIELTLPKKIAHLEKHADNVGNSLEHVIRKVLAGVLTTRRHGVASDFNGKSFLSLYASSDIYNIIRDTRGGIQAVVLREQYVIEEDAFAPKYGEQLRELRVVDGELVVRVWRRKAGNWHIHSDVPSSGFKGEPIDFVPLRVPQVEKNPLYGIASTILKGYQVSADYYGMLYNIAFGTLVISSDSEVTKVETGLHTGLKLAQGDKAELLTLGADGAAPLRDAMTELFDSAVSQGIRIIDGGSQKESGEALYLRAASKQVKLQDIVNVVANEIEEALRVCAMLEGANPDDVSLAIKVELVDAPFAKDKAAELRAGVAANIVKVEDYLKAIGIHPPVGADGAPDYKEYLTSIREEIYT